MTSTGKKRSGAGLWAALEEQELKDDVDDILSMSDTELDKYIADNGGNPEAIRASGPALIKELVERGERLAWHGEMETKIATFRQTAEASKTKTPLPRPVLVARLAAARHNPRFATPAAVLFRKKTDEASTDEELQTLLDELELLAKLEDR